MRVFMLIGKNSCGKTTTLNEVFTVLKQEGAQIIEEIQLPNGKDFSCIIDCHGMKIAFYTMGDYAHLIIDAMTKYNAKGCDMLICACNDRHVTPPRKLKDYPGSQLIPKTVVAKEAALMKKANTDDTERIVEMIKDLRS